MYGYCNTCAFMHNFTPTDVDFFCSKCVKLTTFCILQNYAQSDAITLSQYFHNRSYFINYY